MRPSHLDEGLGSLGALAHQGASLVALGLQHGYYVGKARWVDGP
jgi:hypothetical protein